MTLVRAARSVRRAARFPVLTLWLVLMLLAGSVAQAHAAGSTWLVNRPGDDASDGDLATRQGTLRFALTHAASGDLVTFGDVGADTIFVTSTLIVPPGVAVGGRRDQDCGRYNQPLANLEDASPVPLDPVFRLEAGSTLHNIAIGGGRIIVRITGADSDVDVCGVAQGIIYDGEGNPTTLPPTNLALSINGARATIRRNYINGAVVVGTGGSDTRIGDTIDGNGDGNAGIRDAAVAGRPTRSRWWISTSIIS